MPTDTFSAETRSKYSGSSLWKPWMEKIRLHQISSLGELEEYLDRFHHSSRVSWDVETKSLYPHISNVCGHCLAFTPDEGVYIPVDHPLFPNANLNPSSVMDLIIETLKERIVVVFNWMYEGRILRSSGIRRPSSLDKMKDGLIFRWLQDSDKLTRNLKDAAQELTGNTMLEIHEVPGIKTGKRQKDINFSLSDPEDATLYAAADPVFSLQVLDICEPIVMVSQGIIAATEHHLLDVLLDMMENPVTIDRPFVKQAETDLTHWINIMINRIYGKAGKEFSIDSPQETSKVLIELGVPLKENKKTQRFLTSEEAMGDLATEFPIVEEILYYRSLVKERSTYVKALDEATTDEKPTTIFNFMSVGAPTGRFSSGGVDDADPDLAPINVQSVPSPDKYKKCKCKLVKNPPLDLLGANG